MQQHLEESMTQNEEMADEQINTTATFNIEAVSYTHLTLPTILRV